MIGWNDFVKPVRDKSLFWSEMWKQAGCPHECDMMDIFHR